MCTWTLHNNRNNSDAIAGQEKAPNQAEKWGLWGISRPRVYTFVDNQSGGVYSAETNSKVMKNSASTPSDESDGYIFDETQRVSTLKGVPASPSFIREGGLRLPVDAAFFNNLLERPYILDLDRPIPNRILLLILEDVFEIETNHEPFSPRPAGRTS